MEHRLLAGEGRQAEVDVPIAPLQVALLELAGAGERRRLDPLPVSLGGMRAPLRLDEEGGKLSDADRNGVPLLPGSVSV